jgi:hypothetical protein
MVRTEGNEAALRTLEWLMESAANRICNRLAIGIGGATSSDARVRRFRPGVQTYQDGPRFPRISSAILRN